MAKATDRPKAGDVTVSTVRSRGEARRLAAQLEAAGIECALVVERQTVPAGAGRYPSGGIKVQVDRNDAKRAIALLRAQHGALNPAAINAPGARARFQLPADGWLRTSLEVGVIVAAATILAATFFLY